jgi:hypothetical protein
MEWQWITVNITTNYNLALFIWIIFNPRIGISYIYETILKKIDQFKNNYLQICVFKKLANKDLDDNNILNYFTLFYYYFMVCMYYLCITIFPNNKNYRYYLQKLDYNTDYYLVCCNEFGRTKSLLYNSTVYDIYKNKYYLTIGQNKKNGLFGNYVLEQLIINNDVDLKLTNLDKCDEYHDIYQDFMKFDYIEDNHIMTLRCYLEHHNINVNNKNIYYKYRNSFNIDEADTIIIYERINDYLDRPIHKLL